MKNIAEQILEGLSKFYVGFQNRRVLKTMEEIEANTDEQNIPSALLLGEINNKLNGCSLEQVGEDFYIVGADSVRKKLGSGKVTLRLQAKGNITGSDNNGQIRTWYKSKYYDLMIDFSNRTYSLKMVQDEGNFNGGTATMKSADMYVNSCTFES